MPASERVNCELAILPTNSLSLDIPVCLELAQLNCKVAAFLLCGGKFDLRSRRAESVGVFLRTGVEARVRRAGGR